MKTVVALRHVHFEDLGSLEPLLRARGYKVHYYDAGVHEPWTLNALEPDLLVVLGGPIGAFDDEGYPFLGEELGLIEQRLTAQRPLLGICLGAQLMARALGADVRPMAAKEISFGPIDLTPQGCDSVLAALSGQAPVLHWHGDQFEMPRGARHLAGTRLCPNQAFAIGAHALGLQFHVEADPRRIDQWLVGHACELHAAGVDPRSLREQATRHGADLVRAATGVFSAWLDGLENTVDCAPT